MAFCIESKQEGRVTPTSEDTDEHYLFLPLAFMRDLETQKGTGSSRTTDMGPWEIPLCFLDWLDVTFSKRRKQHDLPCLENRTLARESRVTRKHVVHSNLEAVSC